MPQKSEILAGGYDVTVAAAGQRWSRLCLGEYAKKSGVYVHHSAGEILYVGKTTDGGYGNFGERLRREFQYSSSGNSFLHRLLAAQKTNLKTYLIDLDALDASVTHAEMPLSKMRKALILEQVLIGLFEPIGNRR